MIGPKTIRERADRWWPEVLTAYLEGENIFPRDIPRIGKGGGAKTLADFDRLRREQEALRAGDGKQYTLHWRTVASRSFGDNSFVDRISVDDRTMYLRLTEKTAVFRQFTDAAAAIRTTLPLLEDWLRANPSEVINYAGIWPDLLAVVHYFLEDHRRDRYYIRELPVAVPTKFIETHKRILMSLLDAILPENQIDQTHRGVKGFEARYGLKDRQPQVRLRLLDQGIADRHFSGVNDLELPLDQFSGLDLPLRRVIILENKTNYANLMNFLTLPQLAGSAGIFGSGFRAGNLKVATWLQNVDLLYWGDLDAHGLQIVNQLRTHFPRLRTFLMDRATLDALPQYHVRATPAATAELPHLTATELGLYDYLNDANLRLEQERIPLRTVRAALTTLV